ncbi:vancomycin high temperature exclusion protein [Litchfieldella qijiaojingensis]|uniref:Vancomycin high temperature exclusion protein n=1 Tax=Litchfieldella qijiaojingensis TaxID=980347 RepID=A0ABQ2YTZ2_9GAMM|nr:ElyC/SanA/YdcF family protein [Halomonas qijiaojingensis]GGX95277.1 vancomycin high temperature exclusion protein [Halomonas qijiaojingensis]
MRQMLQKLLKRLLMSLGVVALLATLLFVGANLWVLDKTQSRIEYDLLTCSTAPVGIVFGTSHWSRGGGRNPHFEARMSAASQLIGARRVQHLLLSGDNRTRFYNEPVTMWRDLRGRNVRDVDMTLDYAGFSTFDTLMRSRDIFGVERAMLITQAWHLPRAMFIADALGLEVTGCAVPTEHVAGVWRLQAREWLARVATLGDLYLWQRQPYFLGPEEPLQIAPRPAPRPPRYETLEPSD